MLQIIYLLCLYVNGNFEVSVFLDFLLPSLHSNVQSAVPWLLFWTFYRLLSTPTSNPPHFGFSFGLPNAFPPLYRPIRRALASLLDFLVPSLRSNVQSTMLWLPFLTFCYACIIIRNTDTTNTLIATHF